MGSSPGRKSVNTNDQVQDQVQLKVYDHLWHQVGAQVWRQIRLEVWDQVQNQVVNQAALHLRDKVREEKL